MVTLSCGRFPRGVRRYITTQLAQDDLKILALAIPNVERVTVNRPTDTPGSNDYYHRLPERYPDIDFGVCIEEEQLDHRLMNKYRDNMVVLVVDSIPEYTCISNFEVYFEEGKTQHREVTDGEANRCSYEESLKICIESLFTVENTIEPEG